MVDTSNEKNILHFTHWLIRIYRVGSLSRTIKRYDGVATQGSSILIGYCLYSISYRLTSTSVFITELVSYLLHIDLFSWRVRAWVHRYVLMLYSFQIYYIPLQSRSTIKIQPLPRRSEQISVICYLAWVLRKQLANMSIKIVQISQFCVKTVSLYQECRIRSGHNSSVYAGPHIGRKAQQVLNEYFFIEKV